ncbi:MAG: hypothetical protein ACTH2Q_21450, partial [Propionibacteriaceae bacterium]
MNDNHSKNRSKQIGRTALVSLAACLLSLGLLISAAPPAAAASAGISGNAETRLIIGDNERSKDGTGKVRINYTNGIGIGGNNTLKIWLYGSNGSAFAGPAYLKNTGVNYDI